jgi:DNA-binding GntR family transcriptional regulator
MGKSLQQVDRRLASLSGHAYRILKEAILQGRLRPGSALVEEALCAELAISRTPLREALTRLEYEGLVITAPYKGTLVAPITEREMQEIFQVREPLEVLALHLAWPNLTEADGTSLTELFAQAREPILRAGDAAAHERTDRALHGLLAEKSGNARLAQLIMNFHEQVTRCQLEGLIGTEAAVRHRQTSFKEHLALLNAIRTKDLAKAEEALRTHLKEAYERLLVAVRAARAPEQTMP